MNTEKKYYRFIYELDGENRIWNSPELEPLADCVNALYSQKIIVKQIIHITEKQHKSGKISQKCLYL